MMITGIIIMVECNQGINYQANVAGARREITSYFGTKSIVEYDEDFPCIAVKGEVSQEDINLLEKKFDHIRFLAIQGEKDKMTDISESIIHI